MAEVVLGLARRLRLPALQRRYDSRLVIGTFALVNGFISIGIMAAAAALTGQPFVFPSLGPTAFLLFYTPHAFSACPRSTISGHLIGLLAGYASLAAFGLLDAGPALGHHVTGPRAAAAALSLGLTAGFMVWLRVPHPPAGATTLIVSLGLITKPPQLAVIMLGVVLLTAQGVVINRLAGVGYPLWAPGQNRAEQPGPGDPAKRKGD